MGSVVVRDIPKNAVAVGNPAWVIEIDNGSAFVFLREESK